VEKQVGAATDASSAKGAVDRSPAHRAGKRVPCNVVVALKARRMCGDSDGSYAHPTRFQRFGKGERLPTRPFGPGFGPPRLLALHVAAPVSKFFIACPESR